jgi:hypothetical protein
VDRKAENLGTMSKQIPGSETTAQASEPDFVAPAGLVFDLDNPRFLDEQFRTEDEVIQYLYDHADVDEIM